MSEYTFASDPNAPALAEMFGLHEEPWTKDALCTQTDPDAFFPEKGGSTREAKKVCAGCPAATDCLRYALETDQRFGIWGGMSEGERRRLKKRLRQHPPQEAS